MASKRELGPRLVAAASMARRGTPVDSMRDELRRVIEGRFTSDELQAVTFGDGDEKGVLENLLFLHQRLALEALGPLRDACETDAVAKLLVDAGAKPVHGAAAEALGRTGGADAIRVLEAAMKSPSFGDTRAGFRALIKAKSPNAIPLAISRLDPEVEATTGGWLVPELEQVTGQHLGDDPSRWRAWWQSTQGS
jgi:HEAT repeat protein